MYVNVENERLGLPETPAYPASIYSALWISG